MTLIYRAAFALSAFLPLWIIWFLRLLFEDDVPHFWSFVALLLILVSVLATILLLRRLNRGVIISVDAISIGYRDDDILSYVITYIPLFVLSDFSDTGLMVATISIYFVLAILFIRLDIAYVNPVLALFGFRIASACDKKSGRVFKFITKDSDLRSEEKLGLRELSNGRLYYHV